MRTVPLRLILALGTSAMTAACNGIGDGNTISFLSIVPASTNQQALNVETNGTFRLYQCVRDELLLQGTFKNGAVANFNSRGTWASSDPAVVEVSNRDIPISIVSSGAFTTIATQPYTAGTLIPKGTPGQTAVITGTFAGLSASINVVIRKPQLRVVPVPMATTADPFAFVPPSYLGAGTTQRLSLIGNFDGRVGSISGAGVINTILNPVLWRFPSGVYQPVDEDADTLLDGQWAIPDGATAEASLSSGGVLRGITASGNTYDAVAEFSLCEGNADPDLAPTTTFRVLPFDSVNPITLARDPAFHDAGSFAPPAQFAIEDMVASSVQQITITGRLDRDGVVVDQNLSNQARFNVEPKDGSCDGKGLNCSSSSLFSIQSTSDELIAVTSATGRLNDGFDLVCIYDPLNAECVRDTDTSPDIVKLEACFPLCRPRLANLTLEDPLSGPIVTLTADAQGIDGTPRYVFTCGDGSAPVNTGTTPTWDCDYTGATGPFTATVRVLEDDAAVTVNAGTVQINFDTPPVGNTAPVVTLTAAPSSGVAPAYVFLSAAGTDADTGDSIKVYEFEPEPGVFIRQASSQLTWLYLAQPASGPTVRAIDSFGVAGPVSSATVTIRGTAPAPIRSAALPLRSIAATPCAVEIIPPSATPTEVAYSFPGLAYEAVASFIATKTDATQDCTVDPLIGTQKATRYLFWYARPDAASTSTSEFVAIRNNRSDFQATGQTFHLQGPAADTTLAITAVPFGILSKLEAPTPSSLIVQPCPSGTCPAN